MATVLVGGALANRYLNGGGAWVRLNWWAGLERLGCRVYFVEQIDPAACVDEEGNPSPFETSVNKRYFEEVMQEFGFGGSAALLCGRGEQTSGLSLADVLEIAGEVDLLVNVSGHLSIERLIKRVRWKAYIDLDPGFTQFWPAGDAGARLEGHDHYFTVGENIGTEGCAIPTGGIDWHPLPPPVALSEWPVSHAGSNGRFPTVRALSGHFGPAH